VLTDNETNHLMTNMESFGIEMELSDNEIELSVIETE